MKENQNLNYLHEVARKISELSERGTVEKEEVFDVFQQTMDSFVTSRIIETMVFIPVFIEKESDLFIAESVNFSLCKGKGQTEDEAIENLKEQINEYNQISIQTRKRRAVEEMISSLFPKSPF
jgi:predicted RNase H-like HicB family nuclease